MKKHAKIIKKLLIYSIWAKMDSLELKLDNFCKKIKGTKN